MPSAQAMPSHETMQFIVIGGAILASLVLSGGFVSFRRRSGRVYGPEPDGAELRQAAESLGLSFLRLDGGASISGTYRGVNVIVEARWRRVGSSRDARWGALDNTWEVYTLLRAAFGAKMPAGMHLRRQSVLGAFADALVNGDEISVDDKQFDDAFLIHANEPAEIGRVLTPEARTALLKLATQGDLWVDEGSLRLTVPKYVASLQGVSRVLDALVEAVVRMRGEQAVDPVGALPPTMRPYRTSLAGLLRKAASAGAQLTEPGRAALAALPGSGCLVELEVEHIEPWRSPSGREDGICVWGVVSGGTGRVNAQIKRALLDGVGEVARGDRLRMDGTIEAYDAVRDLAEVIAEAHVERVAGRTSEITTVASPAALAARDALAREDGPAMLAALYLGRDAREVLRRPLIGRRYTLRGHLVDAAETPPLRVTDEALRGGLTVSIRCADVPRPVHVRFPASRNAWLHEQTITAEIEIDATFVEWDDMAEAAVFVEVG